MQCGGASGCLVWVSFLVTNAFALSGGDRARFHEELRRFHDDQAWTWSRMPRSGVPDARRIQDDDSIFPANYWEYGSRDDHDGRFTHTRPRPDDRDGTAKEFTLPRLPQSPEPHVILGVDASSSASEIRRSFMRVARRCHPDAVPPSHSKDAARVYSVALGAFMKLMQNARAASED